MSGHTNFLGIDIALNGWASMSKERENKEVRMIPGFPVEGMGGAATCSRVFGRNSKEEM